jgi:hypothetical protein
MPPASGHWLNNPHADDIDYQIEADFAGLMSPGMPNTASEISDKVGHIMNYGDGWYGGVFVGALYTMAFVSDDPEFIVREALKTIPEQSDFYQCIRDVIRWHETYPDDWKQTWFECEKKWTSEVGCPDGVFMPFDIDAKINSAYVVIGLLYGKGDFSRTIDIAARCGQDADCNPATAAGVLGVMLGYSNIPEYWKRSLPAIESRNFEYTNISLNKIYETGLKHALLVVEQQGGTIEGDSIRIVCQQPVPVKYEKSFEGHFPKRKLPVNQSLADPVEFEFEGIGFVLKGYVQSPDPDYVAQVEMYVDGTLSETIRLPVSSGNTRRVDLCWKYQLPAGNHQVRLKWLNPEAQSAVRLGEAVIYAGTSNKEVN